MSSKDGHTKRVQRYEQLVRAFILAGLLHPLTLAFANRLEFEVLVRWLLKK